MLENVPAELKKQPRWVVWKMEERDGKPTKVPYNAKTGMRADSMDQATWSSYEVACAALGYEGMGCVIGPPYVGIDLDKVRDPESGRVEEWAKKLVREVNSYTELSPSGRGYHIWVAGSLPPEGRRRGRVEMYTKGRYFTVTGLRSDRVSHLVEERDLSAVHARMMAGELDPNTKIETAVERSQSEADFALCVNLAYELGDNPAMIEAEFGKSAHAQRDKWRDRPDYRRLTIGKAIAAAKENPIISRAVFVSAPAFTATIPEKIDWLIEDVIQRGANGFFAAEPKVGKSWAAVDMAMALALGEPWLGFNIPSPVKVALISREDSPALTAYRMKNLWAGRTTARPWLIETNLYVNSRQQTPQLMLDDDEQFTELLDAMKRYQPEFAVFDVFNVLHAADENDNTEMRRVLQKLSQIQTEVGCAIGVVHHYNKGFASRMTQRLRGSSAISGWVEWLIGISMADEPSKTRKMEFELKAAEAPEPIYYKITSIGDNSRLVRCVEPVKQKSNAPANLMVN